ASLLATVTVFGGAAERAATWRPPGFDWGVPEGERAVRMMRVLEGPAGEAYALTNLAGRHHARGELGRAPALAAAALAVAGAVGHQHCVVGGVAGLAEVAADLYRLDEARDPLARAHALAQALHSRYWEGMARAAWAGALMRGGD